MELYIGLLLVFSGIISFLSIYKHVLMMLLSIEFIILGLFFLLCLGVMNFFGEIYFFMLFLGFVACEGSLGLSIIVLLNRTFGNDFVFSVNLLKC